MKITYYPDTDTLYIELREIPGEKTIEAAEDVVIDATGDGQPVGIEIEHASGNVELYDVKTEGIARRSTKEQSRAKKGYRTVVEPSGIAHVLLLHSWSDMAEDVEDEDVTDEAERADLENRKRLLSVR